MTLKQPFIYLCKEIFKFYGALAGAIIGLELIAYLIFIQILGMTSVIGPILSRQYLYYFSFVIGVTVFNRGFAIFSQINLSRRSMLVIFIGGFFTLNIIIFGLASGLIAIENLIRYGNITNSVARPMKTYIIFSNFLQIMKFEFFGFLGLFLGVCIQRFSVMKTIIVSFAIVTMIPLSFFSIMLFWNDSILLEPFLDASIRWFGQPINQIFIAISCTTIILLLNAIFIKIVPAITK